MTEEVAEVADIILFLFFLMHRYYLLAKFNREGKNKHQSWRVQKFGQPVSRHLVTLPLAEIRVSKHLL